MKGVLRKLIRLFIDDGTFALTIIGIVLLATIASAFLPTIAAGTILSFGCPLALLLNARMAARRRRR
ncbi:MULTISPECIES: hypothetical protein [unclassified Bradyrhizobium]|uniref:hypothetical protein n=1 Tax=unclassified Bradyrhizobium TaxID=2631580 RepID=UPI00247AE51C|nr:MULTISPECIES: hypothetical protein [unclassified Bradyrhizobium]WGR73788.1 hypothetical protein MTX24_13665 [Bradyrhizobium sp. ISRA426]WGR78626.1 hypothetical protein MTX21_38635 [Bradyrhizobium sp. ISRA430]WGR89027.1 hypothetical protein MTX25_13680 [Bradyrhizobium sp. ISRA432]